jgi:hypothetical protein
VLKIERDIIRMGGVAKRSELLRHGNSRDSIDLAAMYQRHLICVRNGWYAATGTSADVLRAWRLGGRLACVSAAAHHGLILPNADSFHLCVPRNASRLSRLEPGVTVHWTDRQSLEDCPYGDRAATTLEESIVQIGKCQAAEAVVVLRAWAASVPRAGATDNL